MIAEGVPDERSAVGAAPALDTASPDERAAAGKAARKKVPRSSHGEWEPPARRRDPVEVLEDQARTRVQELVPIRYGRMLASPFTFFRGAAAIMAMDLAKTPCERPHHGTPRSSWPRRAISSA